MKRGWRKPADCCTKNPYYTFKAEKMLSTISVNITEWKDLKWYLFTHKKRDIILALYVYIKRLTYKGMVCMLFCHCDYSSSQSILVLVTWGFHSFYIHCRVFLVSCHLRIIITDVFQELALSFFKAKDLKMRQQVSLKHQKYLPFSYRYPDDYNICWFKLAQKMVHTKLINLLTFHVTSWNGSTYESRSIFYIVTMLLFLHFKQNDYNNNGTNSIHHTNF